MHIHAWVAPEVAKQWEYDPVLAGFEWRFCAPGEVPSEPVMLAVSDDLNRLPAGWAETPNCDIWLFSSEVRPWAVSAKVACLPGIPDAARMADRLIAWFWVRGLAVPTVMSGCRLELINGLASVKVGAPMLQGDDQECSHAMHVMSSGASGGDMALHMNRGGVDLFVLADALGKGVRAALDAAMFAEGVVSLLKQHPLCAETMRALDEYMRVRLAPPRFVAAILIEFDWKKSVVRVVNAGMPSLLALPTGGELKEYISDGPPFGVSGLMAGCIEAPLRESCTWLMTSDGVAESVRQHSLLRLSESLDSESVEFISSALRDDLTEGETPHLLAPESLSGMDDLIGMDDASLILIKQKGSTP